MKLLHRYEPGVVSPARHGLVFHDHARREAVCCLIPFNVIFRLAWRIWLWGCYPFSGIERFQRERKEREHGELAAKHRAETSWIWSALNIAEGTAEEERDLRIECESELIITKRILRATWRRH